MEQVSKEEYELRLAICKDCPMFEIADGRCIKCDCVITFKGRFRSAKCPLGYWEEI